MLEHFEIIGSNKVGLDAEESYVVVRNGISFLRILGGDPQWTVMTATASEDHGRIQVCTDRLRLVESACRLAVESDCSPGVGKDHAGREYVKIGTLTREPGESDGELKNPLEALCRSFFEIYDGYKRSDSPGGGEMRQLYEALTDEGGGDIYLSDGVWLSRDGSLHDRGR